MADSLSDKAQGAWEDTKDATKEITKKTKQKTSETMKGAEQSANFLGKHHNVITQSESKF